MPPGPEPYYPLANLQGLDIDASAVAIAKVTLWMGQRQMIERYGEAEPPLPLQSLPSIRQADALQTEWPETDVIVGNPPFIGDRRIRREIGDHYVDMLKQRFPGIGVIDLSGYWFRVAAERLRPGQRAGFVSTNTLRENKHRKHSLQYVVDSGGVITDAVSNQKWPGEANVHVSITNWVHRPAAPPGTFTLDGRPVALISTQLRDQVESGGKKLTQNRGRCFIGCQPTGTGFLLDDDEAAALLAQSADNARVVRRYLTSDDLLDRPGQDPGRWIIDFATMPLEDARRYDGPLQVVRREVKPDRDDDPALAPIWWRFWRPRPEMRTALTGLPRYIVSTLTGKRLSLTWADPAWCPSNLVGVFAFDDDYSMGILTARAHGAWALAQSSTRETRLRYTPTSAFETYPWPDRVQPAQRDRVAGLSRQLLHRRTEICEAEEFGLTRLYNAVDEGAWTDLKALHRELDDAVAACYGWPSSMAQDDREIVARLTALNLEISEGRRSYRPFA